MHKPTVLFENAFDAQIMDAQEKNIQAALSAALLINSEDESTTDGAIGIQRLYCQY